MTGASPNQLAGAVLAIWTDIAPEIEADFDEWYWREHMPERLAVPGFRRGRRYALDGAPRSFACYDLASLETIVSPAYLERLDHPTTWTKRVMPGFRNTTRAVFRIGAGIGQAAGTAALTMRLSPRPEQRVGLTEYLQRTCLPALHARPGIVRAQLWLAEPVAAPSTREAALRGGADAASDWAVIVEGSSPSGTSSPPPPRLSRAPPQRRRSSPSMACSAASRLAADVRNLAFRSAQHLADRMRPSDLAAPPPARSLTTVRTDAVAPSRGSAD